jgi:ribosome-associated translation inhibitor RaiA
MEIFFKKQPVELSDRSRTKSEKNLLKLAHFVSEGNYEAHVEVEVVRESSARKSEHEWTARIHLDAAGDRYNSSAHGRTAEKAISRATQELKSELIRVKEKLHTSTKRRTGLWGLFQDAIST